MDTVGVAAATGCLLVLVLLLAPAAWTQPDQRNGYAAGFARLAFWVNKTRRRHIHAPAVLGDPDQPFVSQPNRWPR
jgi:hypothetical protein